MGNPEIKLYEYLIGALSDQEEREIKSWISQSDENQKMFDQIKALYEGSGISDNQFNPNVNAAWQAVNAETQSPKQKQIFIGAFYKVAAAVVLVVGLAYVVMQSNLFVDYQTIATNEDQELEVTLPDGTQVFLNENSELKFPREFAEDQREVALNGQAFFDVVRNESKPFRIIGEHSSVEVLGTSFDFESTPNYANLNVVSGKVAFTSNKNSTQKLVLVKGQRASLSGNTMRNEGNLDPNHLAWRTDVLVFNSTPLSEVVEALNKHFDVDITYDDQIAACLITSTFDGQELKEILEILYAISKIENTQDGDDIKLSGPGC